MTLWTTIRVFASRVLGWLRGASLEEGFNVEIQAHLALLVDEYVRKGMTAEEAERAAQIKLGGVTQLKENQRERRGFPAVGALWQDGRYAMRVFRRSPGFMLVGALTIAVGIGVNTTAFTLLNAVAFKKLPVADADDLVRLERSFQSGARGDVQYAFSFEEFSYFRSHSQRLESLIAASWPEAVAGAGGEVWQGQVVSGNYFTALGVNAALGRTFRPEEDRVPGKVPVVVLSDTFWRRHLQAAPGVIGETIRLNGTAFTVIGVVPATFIGTGNPPQVPDFWAPLMMQAVLNPGAPWLERPGTHRLQLLARILPGSSADEARAELQVFESQLTEQTETHIEGDRTIALTLQPAVYFGGTDDVRFAALVALLMAIVLLILFVACANLANMLLARGVARNREIGMRLALGASRGRIVRQLLTESLLLAALGGVTGLLLSFWGSRLLWDGVGAVVRVMFVSDRPFVASFAPDGRIFAFAFALSTATGLLFGLSPALKISKSDLIGSLKDETSSYGDRFRSARSWLIGGQMAISMAFLVCSGLLLKGLAHAQKADPGFDTRQVFMVFMNPGTDPVGGAALQQRIVDRLHQAPEIQDVSLVDHYPFGGTWTPPVIAGDFGNASQQRASRTLANFVSGSYFRTMGIPIQRGRTFTSTEEAANSAVAVISESAARRLWPLDDPIGKHLALDMDFKGRLAGFEVVGVAKDVRSANVSRVDPAYVYLPTRSRTIYNVLVRSDLDATRLAAAVTAAVEAADQRILPSVHVVKIDDGPFLRTQRAITGIVAPFLAALAAIALLLAGIGIYGVTSYVAIRRTREVGIRMALGATAFGVHRLMMRQAMTPVIVGGGFGLAAAAALSRLLQATLKMPGSPDFLFGVAAFDPATFAGLTVFALLIAAAASYIPARRATRTDPLASLRYE
jgi:putative ABC transport system permease protein